MCKVSIILPVFNSERYLRKCIHSVLSQTLSDFELLIIDDGSTDESAAVTGSFKDSRIKYFKKPNGGLSDARNYGLDRVKGEYIYFLDADDWIEPNLLEKSLQTLDREHLDFVLFGYFHDQINEFGKKTGTRMVTPRGITLSRGQDKLFIDGNHLDLMGYAWNKLYRHSFLKKFNPRFETGTNLIEDVLFNTQVFKHSDRVRYIPESYYHYNNRQSQSLLKTFYPDSFGLIKRRRNALADWAADWKAKNEHGLAAYSLISGIRYCVFNLFGCTNSLSYRQKQDYVDKMFRNSTTRKDLPYFEPDSKDLEDYKKAIEHLDVERICKLAAKRNRVQIDPISEKIHRLP